MNIDKIKFLKFFHDCKKNAIKRIVKCYHPNCNEKSINSHILQKNGILSSIAKDNHLWEHILNQFKEPHFQFKRTGINEIFSFNCFCQKHDSELFKIIETENINFNDYKSCLLFTLRTIYNEKFRKEVNIDIYQNMLKSELTENFDREFLQLTLEQEKLGLNDLILNENDIWNDINQNTESYVFEVREISKIELCLSAFYNYETTFEMNLYRFKYGKDMERISEIFINLFPYKDKSVLLMGYNKKDEKSVKGDFYTYFKESEKRVQRKLTNLFLFACETWVISEKLYFSKFKGIENIIAFASKYSTENYNERQTFALNMFSENFKTEMQKWYSKYK
ncbi:hypothetical protein [Flavobacterium frigoris]|uniref:Uncharacterized protein n=1 Tax=Flavobacterium frigoris TaxID=229204 RepID=A0A1H9S9M5_FLAFI|nr:hypothetical protein [Flavobacterium frigoris]SER81707.1 hypothetical protein SAMN05444355_1551 [Flavobacterium frigoris]